MEFNDLVFSFLVSFVSVFFYVYKAVLVYLTKKNNTKL